MHSCFQRYEWWRWWFSHHSETDPAAVRVRESAFKLSGELRDVHMLIERFERCQQLHLTDAKRTQQSSGLASALKGDRYVLQCYHKHFRCHNSCSNSLDRCLSYTICPAVVTFSTEALSYVATRVYLWQSDLCHAQAASQYKHLCFKIAIYFSESAD